MDVAVYLVGLLAVPLMVRACASDRLRPVYLSPPKMLLWFFALIGVGGYAVTQVAEVFPKTDLRIPPGTETLPLHALFVASLLTATGAIVYVLVRTRPVSATLVPLEIAKPARTLLGLAAAAPLLLFAISPGPLLERATYSSGGAGSVFIGAARIFSFVAVVALGYLWPRASAGGRVLIGVGVLLYWAIAFAQASRQFALLPLFFALGAFAVSFSKGSRRRVIIAGFAAVLLVPIPLYLRAQDSHGLFPYVEALPGYLSSSAANPMIGVANIFFGFPALALTLAKAPVVPLETIMIELNPLPGQLAGWYQVASSMRINPAVPYAAVGEVAGAGTRFSIAFWFVVGALLAHIDRRIGALLARRYQLFALMMLALSATFVVLASQYNLRNAFRVLVYLVVLDVATRIWAALHRSTDDDGGQRPSRGLASTAQRYSSFLPKDAS
jgi:hypothetical protein